MTANLAIDNRLLESAFRIGGLKTPKETVNLALEEFIKQRQTENLIKMFHSIEYDSDYDYKILRDRK